MVSISLNMALRKDIETYCFRHGISVPAGFARHAPSRYAIVRLDADPPKLVAKTWINQADVIYYCVKTLVPEIGPALTGAVDILDFGEGRRLRFEGGARLVVEGDFDCGTQEAT